MLTQAKCMFFITTGEEGEKHGPLEGREVVEGRVSNLLAHEPRDNSQDLVHFPKPIHPSAPRHTAAELVPTVATKATFSLS